MSVKNKLHLSNDATSQHLFSTSDVVSVDYGLGLEKDLESGLWSWVLDSLILFLSPLNWSWHQTQRSSS